MKFHLREVSVIKTGQYEKQLWMFGRDNKDQSVAVQVHKFYPFVFLEGELDPDDFQEVLGDRNIISIEEEDRKKLAFFNYNKTTEVYKVSFSQPSVLWKIKKLLKENEEYEDIKMYGDYKLTWADNFLQHNKLKLQTWVEVTNAFPIHSRACNSKVVVRANAYEIKPCQENYGHKMNFMYVRMRAVNLVQKGMSPQPAHHPIISLSAVASKLGQQYKHEYHASGDEREILRGFLKFVLQEDPDVFLTSNDFYNDLLYIHKRILKYFPESNDIISRCKVDCVSRGYNNGKEYFNHPGRDALNLFDMLQPGKFYCKPGLDGYKLENILARKDLCKMTIPEEEVFDQPMDLAYMDEKQMFDHALDRTKKESTWLFLLDSKRNMILGDIEKSSVVSTNMTLLVSSGQQVPLWKFLCYKAYNQGWLMNRDELIATQPIRVSKEEATYPHIDFNYLQTRPYKVKNKESLEGGWVANPLPGFYTQPVATLDFASLYPSIIVGHNIGWHMLIKDKSMLTDPDLDIWSVDIGQWSIPFVKSYKGVKVDGLLPQSEVQLLKNRYDVKKLMKKSNDPFEIIVLDAKQRGLKVVANSLYGFTGVGVTYSKNGTPFYPLFASLDIMRSVTAMGRSQNKTLGTHCQEKYAHWGTEVVYGDTDSVMVRMNNPPPVPDGPEEYKMRMIKSQWKCFDEMAATASALFPKPNEVENEYMALNKTFTTKKKQYMALCIEKPEDTPHFEASGFAYTKRDCPQFITDSCEDVAKKITHAVDNEQVKQAIRDHAKKLVSGSVPMKELSLTCELHDRSEYKAENLIQLKIADKIEQRTGRAVVPGSRIRYVVVANTKSKKVYAKGEDYQYALDHNIKLDYEHYIKQYQSCMEQITSQNSAINVPELIKEAKGTAKRKAKGCRSIFDMMKKNKKHKSS